MRRMLLRAGECSCEWGIVVVSSGEMLQARGGDEAGASLDIKD